MAYLRARTRRAADRVRAGKEVREAGMVERALHEEMGQQVRRSAAVCALITS